MKAVSTRMPVYFGRLFTRPSKLMGDYPDVNVEYLAPPTNEEVTKALNLTTANKASGPDGVPADLFLANPYLWIPVLANVLSCVAHLGPLKSWTNVTIIPIFKKGDRADPKCYRHISLRLQPNLCLFRKALKTRIFTLP